ncbi:hypothetical protein SBRY_30160 [Actinacidiphila bryophytorum]|uniref:Uncharacterized protein n=1 Tax=Actinacidiphila bryophytorum TaxID=1436133 RepID=A0A9W4H0I5_9ACTN|nr:hypothetical protein SBRY_30160 [Actinacidiphila bryophytorum]
MHGLGRGALPGCRGRQVGGLPQAGRGAYRQLARRGRAVVGRAGDHRGRRRTGGDQQCLGQEEHGPHTAVGRAGVHRHREAVARGQHADHREAELRRVAEPVDVQVLAAAQPLDGQRDLQLVHADARVVDDDRGAVVRGPQRDLDRGVRLRVPGGVVQQLRDGEHDRLHRPADHVHVGTGADLDPLVVADTGLGTAQHVDQRRGRALPPRPGAAEHGDGLRAPPELRVGVVDLHQVLQHVRAVVPVLHVGDGQLLLVRQRLDRAHRRLEGGLGRLVGPHPGLLDGADEAVHHQVHALAVRRARQPLVPQALPGAAAAQLHGRQPDVDQMGDLGLADPDVRLAAAHLLLGGGEPFAEPGRGGGLPHPHRDGRDRDDRDRPEHRSRYVTSHQILTNSGRPIRPGQPIGSRRVWGTHRDAHSGRRGQDPTRTPATGRDCLIILAISLGYKSRLVREL